MLYNKKKYYSEHSIFDIKKSFADIISKLNLFLSHGNNNSYSMQQFPVPFQYVGNNTAIDANQCIREYYGSN